MAVSAYVFDLKAKFKRFSARIHQKMNCKAWKAANDILEVGSTCMGNWYTTPYKHRKWKSKMKDFQKLLWGRHFQANFLTKNRHKRERFESYLSEVLWDCLGLFIFSNWTSKDSLERIPTLEMYMSIGWTPLCSSVAFSSFENHDCQKLFDILL